MRGHDVTLYEKEESLGRKLYVESLAPFRADMDLLRKYLVTNLGKLGVKTVCGTAVTPEIVEQAKPDVLIAATGCRPSLPEVPGLESHPHVISAEDVLLEQARHRRFNPEAVNFHWLAWHAAHYGLTLEQSHQDPEVGFYYQLYRRGAAAPGA